MSRRAAKRQWLSTGALLLSYLYVREFHFANARH